MRAWLRAEGGLADCSANTLRLPSPAAALANEMVRINSRRLGRPAMAGDCSEHISAGCAWAAFPLTPALSPGRGSHACPPPEMEARPRALQAGDGSPSPWGEGRGEGERAAPSLAFIATKFGDRHSSLLSGFILDPGNLGNELIERGKRNVRASGNLGRCMGRKGSKRGISNQEHIEVAREILVTGASLGVTHVRGIPREQNVAHSVSAKKLAQLLITLGVIDDHVIREHLDIARDGNRQIPKPGVVEARTGIETWELFEIIHDGFVVG